ncbi:hypothetical protein ACFCYB_00280 [Streptomyces sp. NPDC056309]|uniref:hypothetical protein n=1 Tax=Streptomyces sp. NPDC056309 TaxID=3345781 RepID=UPI0035DEDD72
MADWHTAGCARDCSEQHTYKLGRCALSTDTPPEPTVGITRVETEFDGQPGIVVRSIPVSAWEALVKVTMWVSRGRSAAFIPDPDIAPAYPDAAARRALGALHDSGLLPLGDSPAATQATEPVDVDEHVCKPGARLYYCPAGGEVESDCHGGFDVCCARPDLHQPLLKCNHARLRQLHCPHPWEPQPGMDPVYCEGYSEPANPGASDRAGRASGSPKP